MVSINILRTTGTTGDGSRVDEFQIEASSRKTLLEALFEIQEKHDPTLTFRYSCRSAVCGSCAMYVNGRYRLACSTLLGDLGRKVYVGPMPHYPVVRDLVVDLRPFFEKYEKIAPFMVESTSPPKREYLQTPSERRRIDEAVDCIMCGACFSSCPTVWTDPDYLGPASLVKAYRFVADSRNGITDWRLAQISGEDDIWRCHTIFNCVEACPKKIYCTYFIQRLKRHLAVRSFRSRQKSTVDTSVFSTARQSHRSRSIM